MSSPRATNGFKTKGSRAEIVLPQEFSGSNTLKKYDQGVYVNDVSVLFDAATVRLRPNNDFLKIKNGLAVQVTSGAFDDIDLQTPLERLRKKSYLDGGKGGGYAVAPSHYNLDYDFGQPDVYQDGTSYEDTVAKIDPINVIETDPEELLVPFHIVNASDQTSLDGLIDIFDTRKKVDRDLEIPFPLRSTWCEIGVSDTYRRSILIEDQIESLSSRVKKDGESFFGTDAFLDAGDEFGLDEILGLDSSLLSSSKSPEGFVDFPRAIVTPFIDSNDNELTYLLYTGSSENILASFVPSLTGSRYFPTHDYLNRNCISLSHGFDYDNSITGIDSIAFGGLLK